jgi:hypothetical protein
LHHAQCAGPRPSHALQKTTPIYAIIIVIVQNLVFWLFAHKASVISFCFPVIAQFSQPRLCSTSGAVRESEGNRAALGLAPSCYTAVLRFLFPTNQRRFHFFPIITTGKGQE